MFFIAFSQNLFHFTDKCGDARRKWAIRSPSDSDVRISPGAAGLQLRLDGPGRSPSLYLAFCERNEAVNADESGPTTGPFRKFSHGNLIFPGHQLW